MSRAQQYISSLFEHLPKASLAEAHQQTFDQIKNKIEASPDVVEELKTLYKVKNMSDIALSLLWIAEKVENDPSRLDPSTDEEALVFSMLQNALTGSSGGFSPAMGVESPPILAPETPAETPAATFDFPSPEESVANPFDSLPTTASTPEPESEQPPPLETGSAFDVFDAPSAEAPAAPVDSVFGSETAAAEAPPTESPSPEGFGAPTQEASPELPSISEPPIEPTAPPEPPAATPAESAPAVVAAAGDEVQHAALFEKFIEALQSGAEDRMALFDQLVQVTTSAASGSGQQDYKDYSQLLIDLLKSLNDNQMLDDIRAMNMLSTAFDPFSQWAKADAAGREGLLFQGIEALKGFKALFE